MWLDTKRHRDLASVPASDPKVGLTPLGPKYDRATTLAMAPAQRATVCPVPVLGCKRGVETRLRSYWSVVPDAGQRDVTPAFRINSTQGDEGEPDVT